jgi:hypothetical protein
MIPSLSILWPNVSRREYISLKRMAKWDVYLILYIWPLLKYIPHLLHICSTCWMHLIASCQAGCLVKVRPSVQSYYVSRCSYRVCRQEQCNWYTSCTWTDGPWRYRHCLYKHGWKHYFQGKHITYYFCLTTHFFTSFGRLFTTCAQVFSVVKKIVHKHNASEDEIALLLIFNIKTCWSSKHQMLREWASYICGQNSPNIYLFQVML